MKNYKRLKLNFRTRKTMKTKTMIHKTAPTIISKAHYLIYEIPISQIRVKMMKVAVRSKIKAILYQQLGLQQTFTDKRSTVWRATLLSYFLRTSMPKITNKFIAYQELWRIYYSQFQKEKAQDILIFCKQHFLTPYYQCLIYLNLGKTYNIMRKIDQSVRYLKTALEIQKNCFKSTQIHQEICINLGGIYQRINKIPQALFYYKMNFEMQPLNRVSRQNVEIIYNPDMPKDNQFLSFYQLDLLLQPARLYFYARQYTSAIVCCLKAIELGSFQSLTYIILTSCFILQHQYCKAFYYCMKIYELNPHLPNAQSGLGLIEYCLQQIQCALYHFFQSIKLNPNFQGAFDYITAIYQKYPNKRQYIYKQLKAVQEMLNLSPEAGVYFAITYKLMGYPSKYHSYFDHLTYPIQKDILPQNYFMPIALRVFRRLLNWEQFQGSLTLVLDIGMLQIFIACRNSGFYEKIIRPAFALKDSFQMFLQIHKDIISNIIQDRYRMLLSYFLISQMFKVDGYEATQTLQWLIKHDPAAQVFPALNQLIYEFLQNITKQSIQVWKCFRKLILLSNERNYSQILQTLQNIQYKSKDCNHLQAKLTNKIELYKNNSKKYINFMVNQKGDKVSFHLQKLMKFVMSHGIELKTGQKDNIYKQIHQKDNSKFLVQFKAINSVVEKRFIVERYALKYLLKFQFMKFISNKLGRYLNLSFVKQSQFINLLKKIKNSQFIEFDQLKNFTQKFVSKSQYTNSKLSRFLMIQQQKIQSAQKSLSQQSHMDQKMKDVQQDKNIFYNQINIEKTQFRNSSPKYLNFKKLYVKNSYLISQHLANSNKYKENIIKFYNKQSWSTSLQDGFRIQMQKGNQISEQSICCSRNTVYSWIIDIAQGIIQIQAMGIFHADIQSRNTVSVATKEGEIFKLIDFNYAFKVKLIDGETQQLSIYQNTVKMIQESLKFAYDEKMKDYFIIQFIFRFLDEISIEKLLNDIELLYKKQRIYCYFQALWKYAQLSHLNSYCRIVEKLLEKVRQNGLVLQSEEEKALNYETERLKRKEKTFEQFVKSVRIINKQFS